MMGEIRSWEDAEKKVAEERQAQIIEAFADRLEGRLTKEIVSWAVRQSMGEPQVPLAQMVVRVIREEKCKR